MLFSDWPDLEASRCKGKGKSERQVLLRGVRTSFPPGACAASLSVQVLRALGQASGA